MGASQSASGRVQHGSSPDIAQRARVRNLVNAFQHALHAVPQYGVGSPASERAIESLRETFRQVWTQRESLTLRFHEHGVRVDNDNVDSSARARKREPALHVFHRNGFASLTFYRGFEDKDLLRFLQCVLATRPEDGEDDMATALWSEALDRVEFDCKLPEPAVPEAGALDNPVRGRAGAPEKVGAPDDPPALPEALLTHPLQADELHLSEAERLYLEQLVREEGRRPVWRDVMSALMDSLQDGDDPLRREILAHLERLLRDLLGQNRLRETAALLQEVRLFAEAPQNLGQASCTAVQLLLGRFQQSQALATTLRGIETGEIVPDLDCLADFVACLGPNNVASLVRISERVKNKDTAALLRTSCDAAVTQHPEVLLDLLQSEDEIVLRGALSLMTPARSEKAVREVLRVLHHPDHRMRLAATKALLCVGTELAMQALVRMLDDDHEEVRQASTWALATWKVRAAFEPIGDILRGPRLKTMVLNEKLTYFDAYARLGERRAVPFLDEILNARQMFRPRHDTEMRCCAARALGQISAPEARAALEIAQDDRDPKVKRVVLRHLRSGDAP